MDKIDMTRFEAKKKRIAARLKEEATLVKLREEFGETVGGEWINQRWEASNSNKADETNKQIVRSSDWIRGLLNHLVLLVAFSYLTFSDNSSEVLAFGTAWRGLIEEYAKVHDLSTANGILEFATSISRQELWSKEYAVVRGSAHTILIGGIRLRQLRVKGENCTRLLKNLVSQGLLNPLECYPMWDNAEEETVYSKEYGIRPAVIGGQPFLDYISKTESQESAVQGNFANYPGSGFVAELSPNASVSRNIIQELSALQWLDFKTRALFINFVTYNPDLDLFVITRILFELLPSGVIVWSTYVHAFNLDNFRSDGPMNYLRIAVTCLIYLIVAMKLASLLDECRKNGLVKFGSGGWHYVQTANIVLFVLSGFVRISNNIINFIAFPDDNYDTQSVTSHILKNLNDLSTAVDLQAKVDGLNAFLLWIELGRFFQQLTGRLTRCSKTISNSVADICTFAFLFSILAFAFAVLGFLFHGNELQEFSTVTNCAETLLRAMYGDANFSDIIKYAGPSGFAFILIWLLVSSTVLLNMTVGIIIDTYRRVKEEEEQSIQRPSLLMMMISDFNKMFNPADEEKDEQKSPEDQATSAAQADGWNLSGSDDDADVTRSDSMRSRLDQSGSIKAPTVAPWKPWQDKIYPDPGLDEVDAAQSRPPRDVVGDAETDSVAEIASSEARTTLDGRELS